MCRPVVLDRQSLTRVIEIRPRHELSSVVQRNLGLWSWQLGKDKQQPEPGFHNALGGRFGQLDGLPEPGCAWEPPVRFEPRFELARLQHALV